MKTRRRKNFAKDVWHVKLPPDAANCLDKISAVDAPQLRGLDVQRFVRRLGNLSPAAMRSIIEAIAIVVEY